MNTTYRLLFLAILFSNSLFAQPATDWSFQFGGSRLDIPRDMVQTDDNGFIFIGTSNNNNADVWVTKTNPSGTTLWSKKYGESDDEFGYSICTSNNAFLIVGTKNKQIWLQKISSSGSVLWEKTFGDGSSSIPSSIISTTNGFIIGATSYSGNHGHGLGDFWIFKIDESGEKQWENFYGGSQSDKLNKIISTSDGNLLVIGTSRSSDGDITNTHGQSDVLILKLDDFGDLIWSKNFGGVAMDNGADICEIGSNKYVFVGTKGVLHLDATGIQQTFDNDVFVGSISGTGNLLWETTFGGTKYDFGTSIVLATDGVIVGSSSNSFDGNISAPKGGSDVWLSKISISGDLQWQKSYGGSKDDLVSDIIPDRKGGYIILASTNSKTDDISFNHGNHDAWLYKLAGLPSLTVNLGEDQMVCAETDTKLNATIPNCSNCTYSWSTGETTPKITVSPFLTTTYSVTVTKGGLQNSDDILITVSERPSINETITPVDCHGASTGKIALDVHSNFGPFTMKWSNSRSGATIYNLSKGNYSVTVTDGIGCTYEDLFFVPQPDPITDEPFVENICGQNTKGTIQLNPSGGVGNYSYLWNDLNHSKNRSNLNQGTYSVTISDGNNCSTTETFEILENSVSFVPVVENISCYGKNDGKIDLGLSGNASDYTIHWSYNNFTTPVIQHLPKGTYNVTITNNLGCSSNESFSITQPSLMIVTSDVKDNLCFDESNGQIDVSIEGGTSPYDFSWSNDKKTPKISNLHAGTYQLTVSDAHQCTLMRNYAVKEPKKMSIIGTETPVRCAGENTGAIVVIVSGGTPDYNITLNGIAFPTGLINELYADEYLVVAKDINNCEAEKTYIVTEPDPLVLEVIIQNPSTNQTNGKIRIIPTGGTPGYHFVWNDGTLGNEHKNAGKGEYNVLVTDANGCQKDTTINLVEVAVKNISNSNEISIYPNPTSEMIFIESIDKIEKLSVYSSLGKQIIIKNNILSKFDVNLSNYPDGIYYVLVETSNETYTQKVVLLRRN